MKKLNIQFNQKAKPFPIMDGKFLVQSDGINPDQAMNANIHASLTDQLTEKLPEDFARKHKVWMGSVREGRAVVYMSPPFQYEVLEMIRHRFPSGYAFHVAEVDPEQIDKWIAQAYPRVVNVQKIHTSLEDIFEDAISKEASDIHLYMHLDYAHVVYRCEGILTPQGRIPKDLWTKMVVRLKVLSHLDIAESRRPQFGSFPFRAVYDLRVSFHPVLDTEKVAIRILHLDKTQKTLEELGFQHPIVEHLQKCLAQRSGMIIIAGPTGSGKTTTLYACIQELLQSNLSIATLEDPVEYKVPHVHQSQINDKLGFDYAQGVRSLLRQDPDVILIGEIRDEETARMAYRASMTGHLVLTTVHAQSCARSLLRLMDLGIPLTDLAHNTLTILAQRLVRTFCRVCQGASCAQCYGGYKGRMAIGEMLRLDQHIPEPNVLQNPSQAVHFYEYHRACAFEDQITQAVQRGYTSWSEAHRVFGVLSPQEACA